METLPLHQQSGRPSFKKTSRRRVVLIGLWVVGTRLARWGLWQLAARHYTLRHVTAWNKEGDPMFYDRYTGTPPTCFTPSVLIGKYYTLQSESCDL